MMSGQRRASKGAKKPEKHMLGYEVVGWSSYSAQFHPKNIKEDRPYDQSSRWSADISSAPQYVLLKLHSPALVKAVIFGKHEKDNNCNVRELKVLAGMQADKLDVIMHTGLQNDSRPETIPVDSVTLCQYIMVRPLRVWEVDFHISIWYIGLLGTEKPTAIKRHHKRVQQEATRLCLKHLRRSGYMDCFEQLLKKSKVQLEDTSVSALYSLLVQKGDFAAVEEMLTQLDTDKNIFNEYIESQPYQYEWKQLEPLNSFGLKAEADEKPSMRGGHQVVIDTTSRVMYLFGGWNGADELGDLWRYWIDENRWQCISDDALADGGPCARSCHRMCIDKDKKIYVLGRFAQHAHPQDFRVYDTVCDTWRTISRDTAGDGGPPLIFDHQLVYWRNKHAILAHGGKLCGRDQMYGGMYMFDIATSKWEKLFDANESAPISPRMAHSMFISEAESCVYIFGGQYDGHYRADLHRYDLIRRRATLLDADCTIKSHITVSFSQRVVFDADKREMRFLAGVEQHGEPRYLCDNVLYVCKLDTLAWEQVNFSQDQSDDVPCRRFGHQFVWDPVSKCHFLSAGNPGLVDSNRLRLSDLWSLRITRPARHDVLRKCVKLVRLHRYQELAGTDQLRAYRYLCGPLREAFAGEVMTHAALAKELFRAQSSTTTATATPATATGKDTAFERRTATFQYIMQYLPKSMREPDADLMDIVRLPPTAGRLGGAMSSGRTCSIDDDDDDDDDGDDDDDACDTTPDELHPRQS
ncbi:hypothetical protein PTSG_08419 [Salpingoeca rosetta]|uniref:Muskelin N-terminal domain-containing protein n=1 Tax=Salpingoeca rosetta (strain ATCC 50818 / BSB-021) TaxID=946362 RepID=F2UJM6_SALR5|nr:uncharacterized protein PTSG_08419 [Salpingoeca rosetta]EGD77325.1 hypothetical protein PTSG_08419 [Salpingoeca rosetta]|eukprot:XP_004990669.1 hypothetical protein PTSG_08419 [Salpingoeca rosetta]